MRPGLVEKSGTASTSLRFRTGFTAFGGWRPEASPGPTKGLLGLEGIVSKRLGSRYRSGRSPDWLTFKNPEAPAVRRELGSDSAGYQSRSWVQRSIALTEGSRKRSPCSRRATSVGLWAATTSLNVLGPVLRICPERSKRVISPNFSNARLIRSSP